MNQDTIIYLSKDALVTMAMVAGPLLVGALIVGLTVSLFQAMTQINEVTLTFIPKLITCAILLIFLGHWMLDTLVHYTETLIRNIPRLVGLG